MKESKAILCVGGGSTGIEAASYIKEAHPDKRVVLCQRGSKLLKDFDGGHEKVLPELKKKGVEVQLNTSYEIDSDFAKEFDFVLDCRGFKCAGPAKFLVDENAECVDKRTGQILVNSYGQVTNHHPILTEYKPSNPLTLKNVYSFGDCCLSPANEVKSIVSMF